MGENPLSTISLTKIGRRLVCLLASASLLSTGFSAPGWASEGDSSHDHHHHHDHHSDCVPTGTDNGSPSTTVPPAPADHTQDILSNISTPVDPSSSSSPLIITDISQLTGLVIPQGTTVIYDFGNNADLHISGDLHNSGNYYLVSSYAGIGALNIYANNIYNAAGAAMSTQLPDYLQALFPNLITGLGLNLFATGDIINNGMISSAGSMSMTAGGSIINATVNGATEAAMTAVNNLSLNSLAGNIVNTGLISSMAANVDVTASVLANLNVSSLNGRFEALMGDINFRSSDYAGIANTVLNGGTFSSQNMNFYAGTGYVDANVKEILGLVNITGGASHLLVESGTLNLGDICLSGDPTFFNQTGDIVISGSLAFGGQPLALVAARDITINLPLMSFSAIRLGVTGSGNGGNLYIAAGADFDVTPIGSSPGQNGPTSGYTLTINGASGLGGNFTVNGGAIPLIDTGAYGGAMDGGDITIVAFASADGTTGGHVNLGNVQLQTPGFNGSAGDITIIAGATSGNGITLRSIAAGTLGGGYGGGQVILSTATPTLENPSIPVIIDPSGELNPASGRFVAPYLPSHDLSTLQASAISINFLISTSGDFYAMTGSTFGIGQYINATGSGTDINGNREGRTVSITMASATPFLIGGGSAANGISQYVNASAFYGGTVPSAGGTIMITNLSNGGINYADLAALNVSPGTVGSGGTIVLNAAGNETNPGVLTINTGTGATIDVSANTDNPTLGVRSLDGGQISLIGESILFSGTGGLHLAANGAEWGNGGLVEIVAYGPKNAVPIVGPYGDIVISNVATGFTIEATGGRSGSLAGNGGTAVLYAGGNLTVDTNYLSINPLGFSGNGANYIFSAGKHTRTGAFGGNIIVNNSLNANGVGNSSDGGFIVLDAGTPSSSDSNIQVQGSLSANGFGTNGNGGAIDVISRSTEQLRLGAGISGNNYIAGSITAAGGGVSGDGGGIYIHNDAQPSAGIYIASSALLDVSTRGGNGGGIEIVGRQLISDINTFNVSAADGELTGNDYSGGIILIDIESSSGPSDFVVAGGTLNLQANGINSGAGGGIGLIVGAGNPLSTLSVNATANGGASGSGGFIGVAVIGRDIQTTSIVANANGTFQSGSNGIITIVTSGASSTSGSSTSITAFANATGAGPAGMVAIAALGNQETLNITAEANALVDGEGGLVMVELPGNSTTATLNLSANAGGSSGNLYGGLIGVMADGAIGNLALSASANGSGASGAGGEIVFESFAGSIDTANLVLSANGAGIAANGGAISFAGPGSTAAGINHLNVNASAQAGAVGNGGVIFIDGNVVNYDSLFLNADGHNNSFMYGDGGTISINVAAVANETASFTDAGSIFLSARGGETGGNGGTISISAPRSLAIDAAVLDVSPDSEGWGGNVILSAGSGAYNGNLSITGAINANGAGTGNGGRIELSFKSTDVFTIGMLGGTNGIAGTGSLLNANAPGDGNGGTILIQNTISPQAGSLNGLSIAMGSGSSISAISATGEMGDIFFGVREQRISVTGAGSINGAINAEGTNVLISTTASNSTVSVRNITATEGSASIFASGANSNIHLIEGGLIKANGVSAVNPDIELSATNEIQLSGRVVSTRDSALLGNGSIEISSPGSLTLTGSNIGTFIGFERPDGTSNSGFINIHAGSGQSLSIDCCNLILQSGPDGDIRIAAPGGTLNLGQNKTTILNVDSHLALEAGTINFANNSNIASFALFLPGSTAVDINTGGVATDLNINITAGMSTISTLSGQQVVIEPGFSDRSLTFGGGGTLNIGGAGVITTTWGSGATTALIDGTSLFSDSGIEINVNDGGTFFNEGTLFTAFSDITIQSNNTLTISGNGGVYRGLNNGSVGFIAPDEITFRNADGQLINSSNYLVISAPSIVLDGTSLFYVFGSSGIVMVPSGGYSQSPAWGDSLSVSSINGGNITFNGDPITLAVNAGDVNINGGADLRSDNTIIVNLGDYSSLTQNGYLQANNIAVTAIDGSDITLRGNGTYNAAVTAIGTSGSVWSDDNTGITASGDLNIIAGQDINIGYDNNLSSGWQMRMEGLSGGVYINSGTVLDAGGPLNINGPNEVNVDSFSSLTSIFDSITIQSGWGNVTIGDSTSLSAGGNVNLYAGDRLIFDFNNNNINADNNIDLSANTSIQFGDGTELNAGNTLSMSAPEFLTDGAVLRAGNFQINAPSSSLNFTSLFSSSGELRFEGGGVNMDISDKNLYVQDGFRIQADNAINIQSFSGNTSEIRLDGQIVSSGFDFFAGSVNIEGWDLIFVPGSNGSITAQYDDGWGALHGGQITIRGYGSLRVDSLGFAPLVLNANGEFGGNGGIITIDAPNSTVAIGSNTGEFQINASGEARAGELNLTGLRVRVPVSELNIFSSGQGDGATLRITTTDIFSPFTIGQFLSDYENGIELNNGNQPLSFNGSGDFSRGGRLELNIAGDLFINADDLSNNPGFDPGIITASGGGDISDGGDIFIRAASIFVTSFGSRLDLMANAGTWEGNGGSVTLSVSDVFNSGLYVDSFTYNLSARGGADYGNGGRISFVNDGVGELSVELAALNIAPGFWDGDAGQLSFLTRSNDDFVNDDSYVSHGIYGRIDSSLNTGVSNGSGGQIYIETAGMLRINQDIYDDGFGNYVFDISGIGGGARGGKLEFKAAEIELYHGWGGGPGALQILANGNVAGGEIRLESGGSIVIDSDDNHFSIQANGYDGDGGQFYVRAGGDLRVDAASLNLAPLGFFGNGAVIDLFTSSSNDFVIGDSYNGSNGFLGLPNADAATFGDGGTIRIVAENGEIVLLNSLADTISASAQASGRGGTIYLEGSSLNVMDAPITLATNGNNDDAGQIGLVFYNSGVTIDSNALIVSATTNNLGAQGGSVGIRTGGDVYINMGYLDIAPSWRNYDPFNDLFNYNLRVDAGYFGGPAVVRIDGDLNFNGDNSSSIWLSDNTSGVFQIGGSYPGAGASWINGQVDLSTPFWGGSLDIRRTGGDDLNVVLYNDLNLNGNLSSNNVYFDSWGAINISGPGYIYGNVNASAGNGITINNDGHLDLGYLLGNSGGITVDADSITINYGGDFGPGLIQIWTVDGPVEIRATGDLIQNGIVESTNSYVLLQAGGELTIGDRSGVKTDGGDITFASDVAINLPDGTFGVQSPSGGTTFGTVLLSAPIINLPDNGSTFADIRAAELVIQPGGTTAGAPPADAQLLLMGNNSTLTITTGTTSIYADSSSDAVVILPDVAIESWGNLNFYLDNTTTGDQTSIFNMGSVGALISMSISSASGLDLNVYNGGTLRTDFSDLSISSSGNLYLENCYCGLIQSGGTMQLNAGGLLTIFNDSASGIRVGGLNASANEIYLDNYGSIEVGLDATFDSQTTMTVNNQDTIAAGGNLTFQSQDTLSLINDGAMRGGAGINLTTQNSLDFGGNGYMESNSQITLAAQDADSGQIVFQADTYQQIFGGGTVRFIAPNILIDNTFGSTEVKFDGSNVSYALQAEFVPGSTPGTALRLAVMNTSNEGVLELNGQSISTYTIGTDSFGIAQSIGENLTLKGSGNISMAAISDSPSSGATVQIDGKIVSRNSGANISIVNGSNLTVTGDGGIFVDAGDDCGGSILIGSGDSLVLGGNLTIDAADQGRVIISTTNLDSTITIADGANISIAAEFGPSKSGLEITAPTLRIGDNAVLSASGNGSERFVINTNTINSDGLILLTGANSTLNIRSINDAAFSSRAGTVQFESSTGLASIVGNGTNTRVNINARDSVTFTNSVNFALGSSTSLLDISTLNRDPFTNSVSVASGQTLSVSGAGQTRITTGYFSLGDSTMFITPGSGNLGTSLNVAQVILGSDSSMDITGSGGKLFISGLNDSLAVTGGITPANPSFIRLWGGNHSRVEITADRSISLQDNITIQGRDGDFVQLQTLVDPDVYAFNPVDSAQIVLGFFFPGSFTVEQLPGSTAVNGLDAPQLSIVSPRVTISSGGGGSVLSTAGAGVGGTIIQTASFENGGTVLLTGDAGALNITSLSSSLPGWDGAPNGSLTLAGSGSYIMVPVTSPYDYMGGNMNFHGNSAVLVNNSIILQGRSGSQTLFSTSEANGTIRLADGITIAMTGEDDSSGPGSGGGHMAFETSLLDIGAGSSITTTRMLRGNAVDDTEIGNNNEAIRIYSNQQPLTIRVHGDTNILSVPIGSGQQAGAIWFQALGSSGGTPHLIKFESVAGPATINFGDSPVYIGNAPAGQRAPIEITSDVTLWSNSAIKLFPGELTAGGPESLVNNGGIESATLVRVSSANSLSISGTGHLGFFDSTPRQLQLVAGNGGMSINQGAVNGTITANSGNRFEIFVTDSGRDLVVSSITAGLTNMQDGFITLQSDGSGVVIQDGANIGGTRDVVIRSMTGTTIGNSVQIRAGVMDNEPPLSNYPEPSGDPAVLPAGSVIANGRVIIDAFRTGSGSGDITIGNNVTITGRGGAGNGPDGSVIMLSPVDVTFGANATIGSLGGNVLISAGDDIDLGTGARVLSIAKMSDNGGSFTTSGGLTYPNFTGGGVALFAGFPSADLAAILQNAENSRSPVNQAVFQVTSPPGQQVLVNQFPLSPSDPLINAAIPLSFGYGANNTVAEVSLFGTMIFQYGVASGSKTFSNSSFYARGGVLVIDPPDPGNTVSGINALIFANGPAPIATTVAIPGAPPQAPTPQAPAVVQAPLALVVNLPDGAQPRVQTDTLPLRTVGLSHCDTCNIITLYPKKPNDSSDAPSSWVIVSEGCALIRVDGDNSATYLAAAGAELSMEPGMTAPTVHHGKVVVFTQDKPTYMAVGDAKLSVSANSASLVEQTANGNIRITKLLGDTDTVSITRGGKQGQEQLSAGQELIVAAGNDGDEEMIPVDGLDRIEVASSLTLIGLKARKSEVQPVAVAQAERILDPEYCKECVDVNRKKKDLFQRMATAGSNPRMNKVGLLPGLPGRALPALLTGWGGADHKLRPVGSAAGGPGIAPGTMRMTSQALELNSAFLRHTSSSRIARNDSSKTFTFTEGELLIKAAEPISIKAGDLTLSLKRGAVVYMQKDGPVLSIKNLCEPAAHSIVISDGKYKVSLAAGQELLIADSGNEIKQWLASDHLGRRKLQMSEPKSSKHAFCHTEFSYIGFAGKANLIRDLMQSGTNTEQVINNELLKMAACLSIVTQSHGNFSATHAINSSTETK